MIVICLRWPVKTMTPDPLVFSVLSQDFWFVDKSRQPGARTDVDNSRQELVVERRRRTELGDSDDEDNLGTEGSGGRMP